MNAHESAQRVLSKAAHGQADVAEIEASISRTRADLDDTLRAVERRLSPEEIVDQTLTYLRRGPGEFFDNFGQTVKTNPVPVALLSASLAWLMVAGRRRPQPQHTEATRSTTTVEDAARVAGEAAGDAWRGANEVSETIGRTVSDVGDRAQQAYEDTRGRAQQAYQDTRDRARQTYLSARDRASRMGTAVRTQASRVQSGYREFAEEHPFVLGALAFAVGAAIAAALPRSQREDELMGEARERLAASTGATVAAVAEKAEHVVEDLGSAAQKTASRVEDQAESVTSTPAS